jgi:tRNA(adenine34) deaminase
MLRPWSETDESWMRLALAEADEAKSHADVPVGCVIVANNALLSRDHNRREEQQDPTAHAEILALRRAAAQRGLWRLEQSTLYVTLEPCAMCAGALINARVARVVFGACDPKSGALVSLYQLGQDPRLNHRFEAIGGCLAEASVERLRSFFGELRTQRAGNKLGKS